MSLHGVDFSTRTATQAAKFRPHPGTCLMLGRSITFDISARTQKTLCCRLLLAIRVLALSLHSHRVSEAAAIGPRRTPQPTSSERPEAQETRAGQFPLFVARVCPSHTRRISE
jgi:hypothetical protein